MFEIGYCSSEFSSSSLGGKSFTVSWKDDKGKNMSDDYIDVLYEDKLNDYYDKYFNGKINFIYNIETYVNFSYLDTNKSFIDFEEYIKLVKVKINLKSTDHLSGNDYFHLKTNDNNVSPEQINLAREEVKKYVESKYNLNSISRIIAEIVNSNNLINIDEVYFI